MEKNDNQLIAEFMGYNVRYWGPVLYRADEDGFVDFTGNPQTFHPNLSWDDLMPVVEKIRELTIAVEIYLSLGAICRICYKKDQSFQWLSLEDNDAIRAVYMACVEYIKYYNSIDKSSITEK
jgi:hypothetical protein